MFSSIQLIVLLLTALSGLSSGRRRRIGNVEEDTSFVCPEEFGYYPHPHNCAKYHVCVFGGALLESCTGGLMYSQELQTCDWPRNVVCNISSGPHISTVKVTDPRTQAGLKPSLTELFSNSRGNKNRGSVTSAYSEEKLQTLPESRKVSKQTVDQPYDALNQYLLEDFTLSEDQSVPRQGRLYRSQSQPKSKSQSKNSHKGRPINQQVAASTVSSPSRLNPVRSQQYSPRTPQDRYQPQPQQPHRQQQQQHPRQPPRQQQPTYSYQQTTTSTTTKAPDPYDYSSGYYNASDFYYYDDEFGYPAFEYYDDTETTDTTSSGGSTSGYTPSTSSQSGGGLFQDTDSQQKQSSYQQQGQQDVYSYNTQDSYIYPQDQSRSQQPGVSQDQTYNQNEQKYSPLTTPQPNVYNNPPQNIQTDNSDEPVPIYTRPTVRTPRPTNPPYANRGGSNIIANNDVTVPPRRKTTTRPRTRAQLQKDNAILNNAVNGYQRTPTRTRTRGSSKRVSARPTLKPASTIVRTRPPIDVSLSVPSRPAPLYPQPPVDQPASRCSPDVCLLPDCNCGKRAVPGGYSPTQIPQIVLLTFDDAVNDLNKELYHDLFETGRKNPNGCPIQATFYVSHEWTDYGQVQNLYADGHEIASHSITHSFGEQFSEKKWRFEIDGMRDILAAYAGVHREDIRGMRAPFLAIGGNRMFKMLYNNNYTYDSSMPVYENRPPSWPYTLDYKIFHDCMIPPCPTKSYPGVWEVPMVMWQDLNGGRCSMGDGCSAPPTAEGIYQMLIKNFERHYTTNRAPFGLFYHAAWFTKEHHKAGFEAFLDTIVEMPDVWLVTNWQAIQWVRNPTPLSTINNFEPFGCSYPERPRKCKRSKVCNLWHKSGVRYMRTCQKCPEVYPWLGKTGVYKSRN